MDNSTALNQAGEMISAGETAQAVAWLKQHQDEPACAVRMRELLIGERRDEEAMPIVLALSAGSGAEALVSQSIMAFRQGDLQGAIGATQRALQVEPGLATAHNHAGRALHNTGQPEQALESFRRATQCQENYPEAWHNLGHAQRALGDLEGAVDSFQNALEQAPGYHQAMQNLGVTLFHLDQVQAAHDCFKSLLDRDPLDVEALLGQGLCLQLFGRFDEAQTCFQRAAAKDKNHPVAHLYLGILLNELMDTEAAIGSLKRAAELDPSDVEVWVELGGVYEQSNRLEDATAALLNGFKIDPGHPGLNLETAKVERQRGHPASAIKRLRELDFSSLPARQAQQVWFELGLSLDREGLADEAVEAFNRGNELARNSVRSREMDADAFNARCQGLERWLYSGAKGARARDNDPDDDRGSDLCFLVGFPRSGTTLIDTTLETSPGVVAIEEAATLDFVISELANRPGSYPQALDGIRGEDIAHLRRIYRGTLNQHLGDTKANLIVDKMPLRFMHANLVDRLFPDARMVFVLRHPCDVVLSNFMQQYAVNETNIHFDTLAHSAEMYDRIMSLWQNIESQLEMPVEYVRYEDLVADTASSIARVCHFLGIEAEDISLDRQARLETRDRVRTSSYQQVAEPIYQRAAGRWERYRRHLEPLLPLLNPYIERYGYSD